MRQEVKYDRDQRAEKWLRTAGSRLGKCSAGKSTSYENVRRRVQIPDSQHKNQEDTEAPAALVLRRQRPEISGAGWLARLAKSAAFMFNKRPCLHI